MKVHRYSEHQRHLWVHQMVHKTKTVKAICAEAQISRATLYNWLTEYNATKQKAAGEAAEQTSPTWQPIDKYRMLLSALRKTDTDKSIAQRLVRELVKRYNLTVAQACQLVELPEDAYTYRPRKPEVEDKEVYAALVHALEEDRHRSLEDCIDVLQQAHPGWAVKQIKRIYRQGRLYLKRSRVRRVAHLPAEISIAAPEERLTPQFLVREGAFWHLGVVETGSGWLLFLLDYADGTPLNALGGEGVLMEADVLQFAVKAAGENGVPRKMRIPAVPPFASRDLAKWCWEKRVTLYNLSLAKPENVLEMEYMQDDIKEQLCIAHDTAADVLQKTADRWVAGYVVGG